MQHHSSPSSELSANLSRRGFLGLGATGVGTFGLSSMLGRIALADGLDDPLAAARLGSASAKRVILVFMNGGLSQLDLFDEKPLLRERQGEEIPPSILKNRSVLDATEDRGAFPVVAPKWNFRTYGESGLRLSELIPHIGAVADKLTVITTQQTDHVLHESAISTLMSGTPLLGRPSWGAWISYALGTENENIPAFTVLSSNPRADTPVQPRLWHSGFLPGKYQGVKFRSGATPVLDLERPHGLARSARSKILDAIRGLNEAEAERTGDPEVRTRIESYEMAARMQTSVPELTDLKSESEATLAAYGADPSRGSFANNCLLARRLVERGTRFTMLVDGGWDLHDGIPSRLPRKTEQIDRPLGALIADLDQRGLLDDTLVVVAGEFGRTPHCQGLDFGDYGRDHHSLAGPILMAGGGVKGGVRYGATDDWGWDVVENPVHVHDVQATVLHCLGLDHEKLTWRHQGRDFRLTDVGGNVVHDLLA